MMNQYSSQYARESIVEHATFQLPNAPCEDVYFQESPPRNASIARTSAFPDNPSMSTHVLNHPPSTAHGRYGDGYRENWTPQLTGSRPTTVATGLLVGKRNPSTLYEAGPNLLRNIVQQELNVNGMNNILRSARKESSLPVENSTEFTPRSKDSVSTEDDIIPPVNDAQREDNKDENEHRANQCLDKFSWPSHGHADMQQILADKKKARLDENFMLHRRSNKPTTLHDAAHLSCPLLFGGFSRNSPIRQVCFTIQGSVYCQTIFMIITAGNSLYIATSPGYTDEFSIRVSWYFDFICACIFGFEVFVGMIAYGAIRGKNSYAQNDSFHTVDLLCLGFVILEYVLLYWELWPELTMRPFRMIRIFKPVTKIKMFEGVKNIIDTLAEGAPQLGIIFGFLFLTIIGWTVLTMTMYGKSMRRRCVTMDMQVPACASDFSTGFQSTCDFKKNFSSNMVRQEGGLPVISGGFPFERWCKVLGTEHDKDANGNWLKPKPLGKLVSKGYHDWGLSNTRSSWPKTNGVYHSCEADLWREAMEAGQQYQITQECRDFGFEGNPVKGFSHFDNVWGSTVTLVQVIVPDSYHEVWFRAMESDPHLQPFTMVLFPLITVFDTFLLLGLFVAVVTGTFKRISAEKQSNLFSGHVMHDLETPEPIQDPEFGGVDGGEQGEIKDEFQQLQLTARTITKSWMFQGLISLCIVFHIFSLAINSFNAVDFWKGFGYWSNFGCSMMFLLECLLHCAARGNVRLFFARHRTEFFLVIISIVGLATDLTIWKVLCALRGYRLMRYFKTLEALLTAARASILAIFNVMLFTAMVGLCFTVTGRYLIGDQMNDTSRSNFSGMFLSSLTMFQLFTGDSWSSVMYACMQSMPVDDVMSQFAGCLFVLSWFIFACLVANNLFVAVILENFRIAESIENIAAPGNLASFREKLRDSYKYLFRISNAALGGALTLDTNTGHLYVLCAA